MKFIKSNLLEKLSNQTNIRSFTNPSVLLLTHHLHNSSWDSFSLRKIITLLFCKNMLSTSFSKIYNNHQFTPLFPLYITSCHPSAYYPASSFFSLTFLIYFKYIIYKNSDFLCFPLYFACLACLPERGPSVTAVALTRTLN